MTKKPDQGFFVDLLMLSGYINITINYFLIAYISVIFSTRIHNKQEHHE